MYYLIMITNVNTAVLAKMKNILKGQKIQIKTGHRDSITLLDMSIN